MHSDEHNYFEKPPKSYWLASTPKTNYSNLNEDIKVDVAIVGGGITGISCAYLLIKEGLNIAIIEADKIIQGTTGHTTAKITSQHGLIYDKIKSQISGELAKQYADANESAIRLIKEIVNEHKIECDFSEQSAYVYTQEDKYVEKINKEVKTASNLGINTSFVEEIPFDIPIKAAIRFDKQAQFHPRKYLLALAEKINNSNNKIYEQSRVVDIEKNGTYTLTSNQGKKIIAEKVIIASHYPFYNKSNLYFSRLAAERSYIVAINAKEKYPGGMYITAENPTRSLRSQKTDDNELILVGGEHHKTGQNEDTIKNYKNLIDFSYKTFTVENIPFRWSTQDCMTLDDLPYVGYFTAKTPNLYIATGFGKWGMTNSTASAMILKDLIIDGKSPWQDAYNPSRKTIVASAKNFIVENLNVAKELIEGKITPIPDDIEIKAGEAKVIKTEGQRTGAYRDEEDTLHLINTRCTHMGCELNWNSAETSWDCPCHGSRFGYEGEIIEGPAVSELKRSKHVNTLSKLIKDDF